MFGLLIPTHIVLCQLDPYDWSYRKFQKLGNNAYVGTCTAIRASTYGVMGSSGRQQLFSSVRLKLQASLRFNRFLLPHVTNHSHSNKLLLLVAQIVVLRISASAVTPKVSPADQQDEYPALPTSLAPNVGQSTDARRMQGFSALGAAPTPDLPPLSNPCEVSLSPTPRIDSGPVPVLDFALLGLVHLLNRCDRPASLQFRYPGWRRVPLWLCEGMPARAPFRE
jgi:hypothetical protein